ncbi:hypothetical protein FJ364_01020 [Candidatus Dependentiae bacterium]|nr:hypothetical protein [Candidatus Dependentiae bacterium]
MLKKTSTNLLKLGSLFALTLVLIPGCEAPKKQETTKENTSASTSTVLCKLDGKPVINETEFNNNIAQMLQANPYFKGAGAQSLPLAIKRKFFDELIKQELIIADAAKQNIESDSEFKKAFDEMQKLIKRSLIVQFFEKKIYDGIVIEDAEITKHFEENKDRYVKNPGGVLVGAVRFDSDRDADAFESKTSSAATYADFEKRAKDKKGQFRSFGRVAKQDSNRGYQLDNVPQQIKDAALNAKSLPHVQKVKIDKDIWVFHASDKQETELFELNEIKPQIINMLKNNKFREKLDQSIADLKKKISIDINEDYFKEKKQDATPAAADKAESKKEASPAVGA